MKIKIQDPREPENSRIIIDTNRREAIVEKCRECCGGVKIKVRKCDYTICVLHPFRTGKGKQDPKARKQAIRDDCLDCMGSLREVAQCSDEGCPFHPFRLARIDKSVSLSDDTEENE